MIDCVFINLEFEDGSIFMHHVSWLSREKVRRFFIAGSKGSLKFDDTLTESKLKFVDQGVDSRIDAKANEVKELFYKPGKVVIPELPTSEPLRNECQAFINAIRGNGQVLADGRQGLAVVRILEKAEKSIALGSKRYLVRSP